MTVRSLTLLTALLMMVSLSGCGTDTKTASELGGSGFTPNHFDSTTTSNIIEGYVIKQDTDSKLICGDCHKTNRSDVTINQQWADSAHGGHLLSNGVVKDGDKLSPWAHYNWDDSTGTSADRKACQQCHTATGNFNFMKSQIAGTAYDPVNNDFSHLEGWTSSNKTSGQNELLYCWGCHIEIEIGTLHASATKGITTANWTDGSYLADGTAARIPINVSLPNLGNSNACMGCHTGRGNIETLMGKDFTPNPTAILSMTDATTFSTPKPTATATATHYMNAGATIFNELTKVGYEFLPAMDYENSAFRHDSTNCVACHMKSTSSHSLSVVAKDPTTGEIAAINTQASCDGCHSVIVMNATVLQQVATGYEQALEVFNDALTAKGYIWTPNHPYFKFDFNGDKVLDVADNLYTFTDPITKVVTYYDVVPVGATVAQGWKDVNADNIIDSNDSVSVNPLWPLQGDLGAAHNYNYFHHEAGAYAHNSKYAKRLIFDSVDWLDNGSMDGQITIDVDAYPSAAVWFGAPTGTGGSYVANIRP